METVQYCVDAALSQVADGPVKTVCAGRTDAGVHAHGQVVHFDTHAVRTRRSWVLGANSKLARSVSVIWARDVSDDFHARFSAQARYYRYVILNRLVRPAVLDRRVTWECRALDVALMQEAANYLIGEHDFSSYRAVSCQARNPVRTIHRLEVTRRHELITIDVVANAFLHHMVRNIAGVLMAIGMGKRAPQWSHEVLEARDRTLGGVTAPAHGLYLESVTYPERFDIPSLLPTPVVW